MLNQTRRTLEDVGTSTDHFLTPSLTFNMRITRRKACTGASLVAQWDAACTVSDASVRASPVICDILTGKTKKEK